MTSCKFFQQIFLSKTLLCVFPFASYLRCHIRTTYSCSDSLTLVVREIAQMVRQSLCKSIFCASGSNQKLFYVVHGTEPFVNHCSNERLFVWRFKYTFIFTWNCDKKNCFVSNKCLVVEVMKFLCSRLPHSSVQRKHLLCNNQIQSIVSFALGRKYFIKMQHFCNYNWDTVMLG